MIKVDGQNIKDINLTSLRKKISLVSQDVILFDDTVKNNISYANSNASQEEIEKACAYPLQQISLLKNYLINTRQ